MEDEKFDLMMKRRKKTMVAMIKRSLRLNWFCVLGLILCIQTRRKTRILLKLRFVVIEYVRVIVVHYQFELRRSLPSLEEQ